jgi:hypothetical protein
LDCVGDKPDEAHQSNQRDVGEGDDAVEAPDAEDVSLDGGQREGEDEAGNGGKGENSALARAAEPSQPEVSRDPDEGNRDA